MSDKPTTRIARVLAVDDDPHMLTIVHALLTHAGYEVKTASDGQQGLEVARDFQPDVVISDLQMPRMGGLEFRRETQNHPSLAEIPFVFVTAYRESLEAVTGILGDRDLALQKPIDPQELLSALASLEPTHT